MATKNARELFNSIREEIENYDGDLKEGLSFLDLKNDTLLSYMIEVCNIILRKYRNEPIEAHPSIERSVEYRVILEKVKAIDQKLAYQLNKLIAMPNDSASDEGQRIDVKNLDIDLDDVDSDHEDEPSKEDEYSESGEDEENSDADLPSDISQNSENDSEEEDVEPSNLKKLPKHKKEPSKVGKPGVYKPPKLRSVAYTEEKDYRTGIKGRARNYNEFYDDDHQDDKVDETRIESDEGRTRYEEDNYTRLPTDNPKKAKRKLKVKEYRRKGKKRFKGRR